MWRDGHYGVRNSQRISRQEYDRLMRADLATTNQRIDTAAKPCPRCGHAG